MKLRFRLYTIILLLIVGGFAWLWENGWRPNDLLPNGDTSASIDTPDRKPSRCERRLLAREDLSITRIEPKRTERGCGYDQGLRLSAIGNVRFKRPVTVNCPMAEALEKWVRHDLAPLAKTTWSTELTRIEHLGSYNCRTIAGRRRLSEHSFANALDLSAIHLSDGRRIELEGNWTADGNANEQQKSTTSFWRRAAKTACRRFHVVLTPAYNAAHADHFHLDLGPFRSCRL